MSAQALITAPNPRKITLCSNCPSSAPIIAAQVVKGPYMKDVGHSYIYWYKMHFLIKCEKWTEKDNKCVDGKDIGSKEFQEDKDKKSGSEGPPTAATVILIILVAEQF